MSSALRLLIPFEGVHLQSMTDNTRQLDRRNDLLRMGGATLLYLVPYAMLTPQVVVRLSEAGASATAVSAYGMTPFILILGMSFMTPSVLRRIGMKGAHLIGLAVATLALLATSFLLLADSTALIAYVGFGALLGIASALTWTATEATIAAHAPADPGSVRSSLCISPGSGSRSLLAHFYRRCLL